MGTTNRLRNMGSFLKEIRQKRNITQAELAKKLGYTTSQFVSNWERGLCSPPLDSIVEIANFLAIPKSTIMNLILEQTKVELEKRFTSSRQKKRLKIA
jgi:transcriptional regulator with XRE-family HTH domain